MKHRNRRTQGGFTAIEIALVLSILGLLIGGVFSQLQPITRETREQETRAKMDRIERALASFVAQNYRLPCAGRVINATANSTLPGEENGFNLGLPCDDSSVEQAVEGIVPWRTLGLPEDIARDGWNNYFTYRVGPSFATAFEMDVDGSAPLGIGGIPAETPRGLTMHGMCRLDDGTDDWVDAGAHLNPNKGFFCCASAMAAYDWNTDVEVRDGSGNYIHDQTDPNIVPPRSSTSTDYGDYDTGTDPAPGDAEAIAYILISHGQNGHGAFIPGRTAIARIQAPNPGANEILNADGFSGATPDERRTFVDAPRNDHAAAGTSGYFDDIVLWRTQYQIWETSKGGSCESPRDH